MKRRDFLKTAALSSLIPTEAFSKSKEVAGRVNLKKNVVLINLELGLFAPHFREGGAQSKYMTENFSEFKGLMTYFDGISEPGLSGGHDCQPATFTTMKYADREANPHKKMTSLDQYIADSSVQSTRHPYIYHVINGGESYLSWNRFEQPIPKVMGSNALYEQLFARTDTRLDKARIRRERDILSTLARNLRRYWTGTAQEHDMKASLDHQLYVLDEREKWLKVKKPYLKKEFSENNEKTPLPKSRDNFELIYQALEKQQTKVAVVQYGSTGMYKGMSGIGMDHHGNTHHADYPERYKALDIIDKAVLSEIKHFLHRLQEGGLYDDTIVLFHCAMAYAAAHDNKRAPAFLFGGGFEHKESIQCLDQNNKNIYATSDLFSSVLKQAGFNNYLYNGSKTAIPELFKA